VLFNSYEFVVFFAVVLLLYWSLPARLRIYLLLAASYTFYSTWDYRFLSLILLSTVIDFASGLAIHSTDDPRRRRLFLAISMSADLGILGFFKYYNFFAANLRALLTHLGVTTHLETLDLILPLGISFYTFQAMSYTIDVYRRAAEPSRDFITFATFVSFFPHLIAGPIMRYDHLYPQLKNPAPPNPLWMRMGVFLALQGYVKKVVISDNIAPVVDHVFGNIAAFGAGQLLEAALLFTAQIYCDFSGYSDIARGIAYFLGVELVPNFRAPLLSASITDFWRRWHISLSSWLRDYLYIPLGGNRAGPRRTYANLMTTMLLGGLWHGADWKFIAWGGLHGTLLSVERRFRRDGSVPRAASAARRLATHVAWMLPTQALVVVAFVFFRAASIGAGWRLLVGIATGAGLAAALTLRLAYTFGAIALLDLPLFLTDQQAWALRLPLPVRVALYTVFVLAVITLSGQQNQSFIYFTF
jgi:alginate O-acetyltransferase complex protein AlgI